MYKKKKKKKKKKDLRWYQMGYRFTEVHKSSYSTEVFLLYVQMSRLFMCVWQLYK